MTTRPSHPLVRARVRTSVAPASPNRRGSDATRYVGLMECRSVSRNGMQTGSDSHLVGHVRMAESICPPTVCSRTCPISAVDLALLRRWSGGANPEGMALWLAKGTVVDALGS